MKTYEYSVFLSYNSEDRDAVEYIATHLKDRAKLAPWFAHWAAVPGESAIQTLERGLSASNSCAVFVGKNGQGPWQQKEVRSAIHRQVTQGDFRVIPVLLPDAPGTSQLPDFLLDNNWIVFRAGLDDEAALWFLECGIRGIPPGSGRTGSQHNGSNSSMQSTLQVADEAVAVRENVSPVGVTVTPQAKANQGQSFRKTAIMRLNRELKDFGPGDLEEFLLELRRLIEITGEVKIISIRPGSVRITLELDLSAQQETRLHELVLTGELAGFDLVQVEIVKPDAIREDPTQVETSSMPGESLDRGPLAQDGNYMPHERVESSVAPAGKAADTLFMDGALSSLVGGIAGGSKVTAVGTEVGSFLSFDATNSPEDYSFVEQDFRKDWEDGQSRNITTWEEASLAYRYGFESALKEEYRGRTWESIFNELKKHWGHGGKFDDLEPMARTGWVRGAKAQKNDVFFNRKIRPHSKDAAQSGLGRKLSLVRRNPRISAYCIAAVALIAVLSCASWAVKERAIKAAHERMVDAAHLSAGHGDWLIALPIYQRAIEDRLPDALKLRVERLWGYLAVDDLPSFESESLALKRHEDLGRLRLAAELDLVRGARDLCNAKSEGKGAQSVQKALDHREDLNFSPADPIFAEALLDSRPTYAIAKLSEAVATDPRHLPANSSFLVALITVGDLEAAEEQLAKMKVEFPGSPLPEMAVAMIGVIQGDQTATRESLDRLSLLIGTDKKPQVAQLRRFYEELFGLLDELREIVDATSNPYMMLWKRSNLIVSIFRIRDSTQDAARSLGINVPTIRLLFRSLESILSEYKNAIGGDEASYLRYVKLGEENPEALIQALAVNNRLVALLGTLNRAELSRARTILGQTIHATNRTVDAPTLVPNTPTQYQAIVVGAIADVTMLKITPNTNPAVMRRLNNRIDRLVTYGHRWNTKPEIAKAWLTWRVEGLDKLLNMIVVPLNREQAQDWNLGDPVGLEAYKQGRKQVIEFGQNLVGEWLVDEPGNQSAELWRGKLKSALERSGLDPEQEPKADKTPE